MSIDNRKLKNGKTVYDVRLRDPDGRPYKRTFRTKREAETFAASQRVDRAGAPGSTPACRRPRSPKWLTPGSLPTQPNDGRP